MFLVEANLSDIITEFEIVKEWIDILKSIIKDDVDDSKIQAYYTYGFFVPKSKNNLDSLQEMMDESSKMLFPERLKLEKNKVRVDVTIKIGKLIFSNRLPLGSIPKFIDELVTEIVKVRMTIESEIDYRPEVANSIPPLTGLVSLDIIDGYVEQTEEHFDMDEILDKISISGIESLTPEEKEFLDKKSKDV